MMIKEDLWKQPQPQENKILRELDEENAGKIGPIPTFFTLLKGFIAAGVLFLPKGFYTGGWGFTSGALFFSCLLTIFSSVKLIQIRQKYKLSFSEIGEKAYGLPGKIAVDFFLAFTQTIFVCAYIAFIVGSVDNISQAHFGTGPINPWYAGIGCFLIYTPLCWVRKIEKFAFFHIFADVAIAIGLIVIVVYGSKEVANNGFSDDSQFFNSKTFLSVIGLAAYTFEGIGIVIPVMETTSRPDLYPYILSGVIVLVTFIYLFFGNWMYFSFGRERIGENPLITDALPPKDIAVTIVEIIWIINLIFTYPLVLHPANMVFESYAFPNMSKGIARRWAKNFTRTLTVAFTVVLSIALEDTLDKLESINGAMACIPLAFLLPCLFHYKLIAETSREKIIDLSISVLSFVLMIACSTITFITWNE